MTDPYRTAPAMPRTSVRDQILFDLDDCQKRLEALANRVMAHTGLLGVTVTIAAAAAGVRAAMKILEIR